MLDGIKYLWPILLVILILLCMIAFLGGQAQAAPDWTDWAIHWKEQAGKNIKKYNHLFNRHVSLVQIQTETALEMGRVYKGIAKHYSALFAR